MYQVFNLQGEQQKTIAWATFHRQRMQYNHSFAAKVRSVLQEQTNGAARAFENELNPHEGIRAAERYIEAHHHAVQILYRAMWSLVTKRFALMTFRSIRKSDEAEEFKGIEDNNLTQWQARVDQFLREAGASRVTRINETTRRKIQEILQRGIDEGKSIPDMARDLRSGVMNDINFSRGVLIARTEIVGASNYGNRLGAKSTGLHLKKEWIATKDDRTRDDHAAADGQVTEMDDTYDVGGEGLLYPGDPSGSAENVINCRCTEGYITD